LLLCSYFIVEVISTDVHGHGFRVQIYSLSLISGFWSDGLATYKLFALVKVRVGWFCLILM